MRFTLWGMSGTLLVTDPSHESAAKEILWSWSERADASVNRFNPDSEISRLNASGELDNASDDFFLFVDAARTAYDLTEGLCDPTVLPALRAWGYRSDFDEVVRAPQNVEPEGRPTHHNGMGCLEVEQSHHYISSCTALDFGASAKAYVVDAVVAEVSIFSDVLVEIGGDVAVSVTRSSTPFVIGVAPDGPTPGAPAIELVSGGVATSSTTYRAWDTNRGRAHHIIDPRTGNPAMSRWSAVTVAAPTCLQANAVATAAFLWDDDAPWYIAQTGWAGRLVAHDGEVALVGSWPKDGA